MSQNREERIRQRAYAIWESEGRPADREDEHWRRAEEELRREEELQRPAATVESSQPARAPHETASQSEQAVEALEAVSGSRRKRRG
jgi:hypothetical protein